MGNDRAAIRAAVVTALQANSDIDSLDVYNNRVHPVQGDDELPLYNVVVSGEAMDAGDEQRDNTKQTRVLSLQIECMEGYDDETGGAFMDRLDLMAGYVETAMDSEANVALLGLECVGQITQGDTSIVINGNDADLNYGSATISYAVTYYVESGVVVPDADDVSRIDTDYDMSADYGYTETDRHALDETDVTS